ARPSEASRRAAFSVATIFRMVRRGLASAATTVCQPYRIAMPSGMPGRTGFGFGAKRDLSFGRFSERRPADGLRGSHLRSGMLPDPTRGRVWLAAFTL